MTADEARQPHPDPQVLRSEHCRRSAPPRRHPGGGLTPDLRRRGLAAFGRRRRIVIVGGGPAGALLAVLLADAGCEVDVYESRPDLRRRTVDDGRSINLTLAHRGIVALDAVGVMDRVDRLAVPLAGRMVHADGRHDFHPYGRREDDVIHSISRTGLNAILLDRAEATGRVRVHFDHRVDRVDLDGRRLAVSGRSRSGGARSHEVDFDALFGADGSNSVIRAALADQAGAAVDRQPLDHGYKELSIPAGPGGRHVLAGCALHVWPRGEFVLMAFANPDGSFTATLFLARDGGDRSFASLTEASAVERFFADHFPTFVPLAPRHAEEFLANPIGRLETIRTEGWSAGDHVCLVGDAAHTLVPFHGQGMNLALESVATLADAIAADPADPETAFALFEEWQKPNADAIADMALANYHELRFSVTDPAYLATRELGFALEQRYPDHFGRRYDLVTFTTMPFADVAARDERQNQLLRELLAGGTDAAAVDVAGARQAVEALGPLPDLGR